MDVEKSEHVELGLQTEGSVDVDKPLHKVAESKYLGSHVPSEKAAQRVVNERVNTVWSKCRKFSGVMKPKIYRTVIRPAAIKASECWLMMKQDEMRASVMLGWRIGTKRLDRIETSRKVIRVAAFKNKLRKKPLGWFEYTMRRKKCQITRQAMASVMKKARPREKPK